jgi:6-phosphogluconolactonase
MKRAQFVRCLNVAILFTLTFSFIAMPTAIAKSELVYVCAKGKGIYSYRMDLDTGALSPLGLAAQTTSASFMAVHPNREFVYIAGERKDGAVTAFSIDRASGKLTLLNKQSSRGSGPAHLAVDNAGKNVLVANYASGSVAVLPIQKDGSLKEASAFVQHAGKSVNPKRQEGPHAHHIITDAAGRFALVCDLGLDQVLVYKFDSAKGTLTPNDPPFGALKPGAGPRHLAFGTGDRFAYVINELDSTVTTFQYDSKRGAMKSVRNISTLPPDFAATNYPAEIAVHPSGKFLYGSNRGHDSIAVYAVDGKGQLSMVEIHPTGGQTPRHFEVEPTGKFLLAANQDSGTINVFRIDGKAGRLSPTGQSVEVDTPFCVKCILLGD